MPLRASAVVTLGDLTDPRNSLFAPTNLPRAPAPSHDPMAITLLARPEGAKRAVQTLEVDGVSELLEVVREA